jgi:glycosyltransferase involved in cell wall biosynthesis
MAPKISIIMITRNRASFLTQAIKSAQNQSFIDWELIVSDDDSNDDTVTVLASIITNDSRIKYFKNTPALGISGNRNKTISISSGKYIAVLDSDDFWIDNNKLQKQYDFLEANPDYVLIGSNIKIIDEKGNFLKETTFATENEAIRKEILKNNQIPHSTILMRKNLIEKVGNYNEKISCVEDLDLFLKLGKLGKFKNLPEITTAYTRHSSGASHQKKIAMAWNHFMIILKNFGKYPNWFSALVWAKLRFIKSLF